MDGLTFSSRGISLGGAQPVTVQGPTLPNSGQGAPSAGAPPPAPSHAASPAAVTPAFVVDFSGSTPGSYVLDWRDPVTKAVIVQVPMRTALAQFVGLEGAGTPEHVGKRVDTTA